MPVKFKKGSKEAKAHMAKIRAMRGAGAGKHTDTKSHNVNIKVVSGNIGSLPFTGKFLGVSIKATKEPSGVRLDIGKTRMGINKNTDINHAVSDFIYLLEKQYGYKLTESELIRVKKAAKPFIVSLKKEAPSIRPKANKKVVEYFTSPKKETTTKSALSTRQTGSSNKNKDEMKKAKAPGKRKSASGKTYYERRANRSDKPGSLLGILSGNIYNVRDSLERDISKNLEQLKRIKSYKQSAMTKKAITHIANHIVLLKKQLREQNKIINQNLK